MDWNLDQTGSDDLSREVYCILGIPIDAIGMPVALRRIKGAAAHGAAFTISTPNLNFLVNSQSDPEFRESLLQSDLCPADGMPIVWIARALDIPVRRIAGSDIFESLKNASDAERPLKIFLFGSTEQVAEAACRKLNSNSGGRGLVCVGWVCPGFGDVDDMSQDRFIEQINSSNADFLVAALGATKGQLWLRRNHDRLQIPIRSHLGATINFQAGTIKRAPPAMQKMGLEWLWRIREEPHLWRRYWHDGRVLLSIVLTRVLPLAVSGQLLRWKGQGNGHDLVIESVQSGCCITVSLSGVATANQVEKAILCFRDALTARKRIVIDLSKTRSVDARFFGLLLMLRKCLKAQNMSLQFTGISHRLRRLFRLNGLTYLLSDASAV